MEEFVFYVQGSATEPYKVTFRKDKENISAYCTCPAGSNGQYCKHRFNILSGIIDGIVSQNSSEVALIVSWLTGTDVEAALNDLADAENQFELSKLRVATAKKRLARAFRD